MFLAGSLVGLSGCDLNEYFFVYQNQVPEAGCMITTDKEIYRQSGVLDLRAGRGYYLFPLLENELPPRKDASDLTSRTDPNMITMRHFTVDLEFEGSDQLGENLTHYEQTTSGVLLPGDLRAAWVKVISDELAQTLRDQPADDGLQVTATVRGVGTLGRAGEEDLIETQPFVYSIELCSGCLVPPLMPCSTASVSLDQLAAVYGNTCGMPQDEAVFCCTVDGSEEAVCLRRPSENQGSN